MNAKSRNRADRALPKNSPVRGGRQCNVERKRMTWRMLRRYREMGAVQSQGNKAGHSSKLFSTSQEPQTREGARGNSGRPLVAQGEKRRGAKARSESTGLCFCIEFLQNRLTPFTSRIGGPRKSCPAVIRWRTLVVAVGLASFFGGHSSVPRYCWKLLLF